MDVYSPLLWKTKLSYGVGHVLNDLCASMWFSYLLLYFESVNLFTNSLAGYVLLLGQVADAIATPLIGYESDRIKGFCGYGRRKSWHALGTLCVFLCFPFIFMQCITCAHTAQLAQFLYYAPFVLIFQFGWASTQISHLALIPELAHSDNYRVELNAIRYAFTVISNLAVYGLTWLILSQAEILPGEKIGPSDADKFREIALIVVGVGVFFSAVFHVGTPEKSRKRKRPLADYAATQPRSYGSQDLTREVSYSDSTDSHCNDLKWSDWLREYQFYLVAVLYMCTRLIVNLSQIYLPMYVMHTVDLQKRYVAIVPLVVFASGFVVSFAMRSVNKEVGRKLTYILGLVLVWGGCAWMWFLPQRRPGQMFGAAVFLGAGTSTILVTSLAMTSDLIGHNTGSSAFVYGAMSFTDKLSNGVAVVLIQHFHPCNSESTSCCAACVWYYRHTIVIIPGAIAALAFIVLIVMVPMTIGNLHRGEHVNINSIEGERGPVIGPAEITDETSPLIGEDYTSQDTRPVIEPHHVGNDTDSMIGHDLISDGTATLIGQDPAENETQSLIGPTNNSTNADSFSRPDLAQHPVIGAESGSDSETRDLIGVNEIRNEPITVIVTDNSPISV